MADVQDQFRTFEEFWPYYLGQHRKRETRILHVVGTLLAVAAVIKAVISLKIGWLIVAPIIGYGFAWCAHAYVEENRPATFEYPLWSLRADFQMLGLWLSGKLEAELTKHDIMT